MLRTVDLFAALRRLVGAGGPAGPSAAKASGDPNLLAALASLERFALLGRMTAAFAHDMRTPLHVISSNAETAQREFPRGSRARRDMEALRLAARA